MQRRIHRSRKADSRGFSLIELLLSMLIIGLLASVLVPNLIDALQKAKQKRTMADMKGIGSAWMSWMTDQNGASSAGSGKVYDTTGYTDVTFSQVYDMLHPTDTFFYAVDVPEYDAWGGNYVFNMVTLANGFPDAVAICSLGRDEIATHCGANVQVPVGPFITTDYDSDIVWADGYFVRWPEGATTD